MGLEVSSRGGFGSFEAGWERLCEFSSEESGKSVDVEARSRGGEQETSRGVRCRVGRILPEEKYPSM